jgi:hypothetical protein
MSLFNLFKKKENTNTSTNTNNDFSSSQKTVPQIIKPDISVIADIERRKKEAESKEAITLTREQFMARLRAAFNLPDQPAPEPEPNLDEQIKQMEEHESRLSNNQPSSCGCFGN